MLGAVALVLHAHLPYVRHPEHERSLEERWLFEALWESYLPIVDVLGRLARDGVRAPITVSISPTLLAMLDDELLRSRFDDHLDRLERLAAREEDRPGGGELAPTVRFYRRRLEAVRAIWSRIDRDLPGALGKLADAGAIELATTSATHAYLPGLLASPGSIRAQLRLGRRAFERRFGRAPVGLWLPECAFDPRLDEPLARAGVRFTVLDAHGLEIASPPPPFGVHAPILGPKGVAYFARDPRASREVWSRRAGYPGNAVYRDFYRDVGFDRDEVDLEGHVGPHGTRVMTGLKLHRITGPHDDKAPYDRDAAIDRARRDAADFVARRSADLAAASRPPDAPPIAVAPYDAELFGHWWFEGPEFLEAVLRRLAETARAGGVEAVTLGGYLARFPEAVVATPAASTWGEGGYGDVWTGREAAALWRHVHHAERAVTSALTARRGAVGALGEALDQAIRELLLLQASDWPFMLRRGEVVAYAEQRIRAHHRRATRLAEIAMTGRVSEDDARWMADVRGRDRFLAELEGEAIRDAFDPA